MNKALYTAQLFYSCTQLCIRGHWRIALSLVTRDWEVEPISTDHAKRKHVSRGEDLLRRRVPAEEGGIGVEMAKIHHINA